MQPLLLLPLAMVMSMQGGAEFWGVFCGLLADITLNRPIGFNIILILTACLGAKLISSNCSFLRLMLILFLAQAIWTMADYTFFAMNLDIPLKAYLPLPILSIPFTVVIYLFTYKRKRVER